MALLEIKNVSKRFGGLWALRNVSFEVEEGEIIGIIGPNGAGKTTLFNCITGFYKPDTGRIVFRGEDITGLPPYAICKKGITRTFQLTKAFNNLTVFDNVRIAALTKLKDMKEAEKEALNILEILGLSDKKYEIAGNLTVLERKRLELARALATKPKLLLLDEVMAGLKPAEIDEILEVVRDINKRGVTIIIVEHVIRAIMNVCKRVVVLDYGKKIAEGPSNEIVKDPRVVKAYLGEEYVA